MNATRCDVTGLLLRCVPRDESASVGARQFLSEPKSRIGREGLWRRACQAHNLKVVGSNPAPATILEDCNIYVMYHWRPSISLAPPYRRGAPVDQKYLILLGLRQRHSADDTNNRISSETSIRPLRNIRRTEFHETGLGLKSG